MSYSSLLRSALMCSAPLLPTLVFLSTAPKLYGFMGGNNGETGLASHSSIIFAGLSSGEEINLNGVEIPTHW